MCVKTRGTAGRIRVKVGGNGRCGNQNVQDTFNMVEFEQIRREGSVLDLRRSSKQK